ncbi:MAG: TIM barrel protein [Actinobacteria bacterium]|nr:TIM barrel protein [Actinomycetota bacterium]
MFVSGIADEAGQDIDTQIRAHRALGWKHIELRNIDGVTLANVPEQQFEQIVAKLSQANLKVSCFASALCNWSRKITNPFEIDSVELARAISRMQRLKTKFIRIMSYPNASLSQADWKKQVVSRIKELARMAEDGGILLLHENCDGWAGQSPRHSLELLDAVDSPALKLLYDTGNPVLHDQDGWEFYSQVADHIVYVHIKDGLKESGNFQATFPGEGQGQVERILTDLFQRGYDGGFSIEPHLAAVIHENKQADDPAQAYELYLDYGRRTVDLLEKSRKAI